MDPTDLKIRRVRAGSTQNGSAQKSRVHPARVSEMERGHRPIAEAVVRALDEELAEAGV